MELNNQSVEFSKPDIKRKVNIPKRLTDNLAELIGFIVGDGHLAIYKNKGYDNYQILFSGHATEDLDHYNNWINLSIKNYSGNEMTAKVDSKAILKFLNITLQIPSGNKAGKVVIPKILIKNSMKFAFIRGLFDSDGSLTFKKKHKETHYYPVIKISSKSKKLIEQITKFFINFNVNCYATYNYKEYDKRTKKYYIKHEVFFSGFDTLSWWITNIKFNNPKHITKYLVWKKYGFCPPYTNLNERKRMLEGTKNPFDYYKIN